MTIKNHTVVLILILLLGAFFRLYKINEYMTFLGDEGRDVLVVKRMLVDHKFTLLGPVTSVGSMYMGPVYYYLMTPFLWLWNFDPVGPSIMVALFAVATIYLIYKLGSEFFHPAVGLISAFLYAVAPLTIYSGRSSWNPNVVPFFSMVLIYSLLKVLVCKNFKWFTAVGLSLGILFQLHYVTLIFIPIIITSLLWARVRIPLKSYLIAFISMLVSYSPFLFFELRHQFVNLHAVVRFIFQQNPPSPMPFLLRFWYITYDVLIRLFWRLLIVDSAEFAKIFILFIILILAIYYRNFVKQEKEKIALKILVSWLVVGILSFGFYHGSIYDYYFGSLFALPFVLSGIMFYTLWRYSPKAKILSVVLFAVLSFMLFKNSPLRNAPSNLLANSRKIAEFVFQQKDDKPYNFALIAGKNSDHAYRYFLELWGSPPVTIENPTIDPDRRTVTDQLLIVCEEKICQPLGHPLWEIAGFGRAEIASQWPVVTTQVFKLVHYNNK